MQRFRKRIASTMATAMVVVSVAAPVASAQPDQDGLVNVAIGDITVQDVNVGVAAQIAAQVCGVKVGPVAVLARAVDRSGDTETVCEAPQNVELQQN